MHTSALGAAQDSLETAPVAFSEGAIVCSAAAVDEVVVPVPSEILQEGRVRHRDKKQKAAKGVPRGGPVECSRPFNYLPRLSRATPQC